MAKPLVSTCVGGAHATRDPFALAPQARPIFARTVQFLMCLCVGAVVTDPVEAVLFVRLLRRPTQRRVVWSRLFCDVAEL